MKNLIISGGTGGIGSILTKSLLGENHNITIIGRNEKKFNASFFKDTNVNFFSLDISSFKEVEEFFKFYVDSNNSLFALINLAGVQLPIGNFLNNDYLEWRENLKTNIIGTANMIRCALPLLQKGKFNKIINFSGGGATSPRPNFSAYAISKISIVKLTEILAYELKDKCIDITPTRQQAQFFPRGAGGAAR